MPETVDPSNSAGRGRPFSLWGVPLLIVLTFAIPALQGLLGAAAVPPAFRSVASGMLIALGAAVWQANVRPCRVLPASPVGKIFCAAAALCVLGLFAANLLDPPAARISGLVRTPAEILDGIVVGPAAEEWLFRGILWWLLPRLFAGGAWGDRGLLLATSAAFGAEHLGYWALSHWPLPAEAFVHALAMVPAGMALAALRLKSRSLGVPMAVHMLANGLILLVQ